ncbi:MAG: FAD-dependent oxidoreductase [Bacteroidetes bacterium]|jgi:NAD(P)H-nitrite reductase large subunit|uniref:NAD(P)/FAD-dependent oxidoreductase n=1 Tax=Daejeonella sp. TaxID=2805397 RepID=UPI004049BF69|nr:FAD-dependent oxidoreductase [Bacteroidota bacterium]
MNIIIIGNGITGITCARNIRKKNSDATITVISEESKHFYSRTALMYIYMGHMKYENTKPYEDWFWSKNRINLIQATVKHLNTENKSIQLDDSRILYYDKLVVATGSISNKFGFQGEDLTGVQALYNLQDLQKMEKNTSNISSAVIVGGGLIGIEMAEMLHSRNISVTMLIRENAYWVNVLPQEEAQLIGNHLHKHGIKLKFNTELKEIQSIDQVSVHSIVTKQDETINCQFLGITTGVKPNINFLKNSSIEIEKGILVNEFLETNIPDIFAAGDCAQFRFVKTGEAPIEQLWYTGKMQGETLANTICGNKTTYDRGIWFNSAKFFDLEFQTYGKILPEITPEQESFYWEHENGKISFRANYNKSDQSIIGFNFIGIRFRQVIAELWIHERKEIEYVIENLKQGWFDPEFSDAHYEKIAKSFSVNHIN